jgi:hypothetical protein
MLDDGPQYSSSLQPDLDIERGANLISTEYFTFLENSYKEFDVLFADYPCSSSRLHRDV